MASRKSNPRALEAFQRQLEALQLRKGGNTYQTIADQLGYADASGAFYAVQAAMTQTLQEAADDLRRIEVERLDELFEVAHRKATGGDKGAMFALDRCLAIMDRRAKMLGLDAPQRKVVNVITEDLIDIELQKLEAQLAANDDPNGDGVPGQPSEAAATS